MENKKNKIKLILPLFIAVFCLALFPFSINKVKAESYEDITNYYLWGNSSVQFHYTNQYNIGEVDVISLPFTRLNTTNRVSDNFQWHYYDVSTEFEYLVPHTATGLADNTFEVFEIVSNNFFVPIALINDYLLGDEEGYIELLDYAGYNVAVGLQIRYLGADYSEKYYNKVVSLDATNPSIPLDTLTAEINTASFYHFNKILSDNRSANFGLITEFRLFVEQIDYGTSDSVLHWYLSLYMFDNQRTEFDMPYSDYLDAQTELMSDMIFNYNNDISIFRTIVASVNDVLQIEILPSFRIMDILLLAITIPLTVWLLKAWLGG